MNNLIFISSPYTHESKDVINKRVEQVTRFCGKMMLKGYTVISPITYGHAILEYTDMGGDWETWNKFCESLISKCDEMWVLKLDGWEESVGIQGEIVLCEIYNIPIKYVEYG